MLQTPRASLFGQVYKRWHNLLENISEHQQNISVHKTQVHLYKGDFRMPNPDIPVDHSERNHNQGRKWNLKTSSRRNIRIQEKRSFHTGNWTICIRDFLIWETKKMHYRHIYKTLSSGSSRKASNSHICIKPMYQKVSLAFIANYRGGEKKVAIWHASHHIASTRK